VAKPIFGKVVRKKKRSEARKTKAYGGKGSEFGGKRREEGMSKIAALPNSAAKKRGR
jgi:hypothetical protein